MFRIEAHRADTHNPMKSKNRRKRFLIHKKMQLHYVLYIAVTLTIVSAVGMTGIYFGIWGSIVTAFSEDSLRQSMITAAQISEYEQARRRRTDAGLRLPSVRIFRETALLSERQKEMIREIMDETNQKTLGLGTLLLIFIGWGSIFLTHKIAGPVFKLRQYCKLVEKGDLTIRIKFRKFDEIPELAEQFNNMIAALDASLTQIKRISRQSPPETALHGLQKEFAKIKTTSD